jgi:hypothetical protein
MDTTTLMRSIVLFLIAAGLLGESGAASAWRILLPKPVLSRDGGKGDGGGAPTPCAELTIDLPAEPAQRERSPVKIPRATGRGAVASLVLPQQPRQLYGVISADRPM